MLRYNSTKTRLFKYTEFFYHQNNEIDQIKNSDIFHISAQSIDCGPSLEPPRLGDPYEYPQSMYLGRNKKNDVNPCKPQFLIYKSGFKGSKLYKHVFVINGMQYNRRGKRISVKGLSGASRKHAYIILTPLNPTFIQ